MSESRPVITVYTNPSCMACDATKKFLSNHNTRFAEVNLEEDKLALAAAKDLGYRSAPVVFARYPNGTEQHWTGFRPDLLAGYVAVARKWARHDS